MINYTATYTDHYQLAMAQAYFLQGQGQTKAVFDYFFRKSPFSGGYTIFAGLEELLAILSSLRFDKEDLLFLAQHKFHPDFLSYLESFQFQGSLYAALEGEVVFPTAPLLSVEASLIEAQLIETLLINVLNFQSLVATKASRMRLVAGERKLIDFGLRRAQGLGGYYASRAAILGGFNATSNVRAGRDYAIPIAGTMAHAFIQSYENELEAFRAFAQVSPENCVLLVDTYNTLDSGLPNAITVAKEMEARGQRLRGIRLDSGDLAYLAKRARQMLDKQDLDYVKITASNQLDEWVIKSLLEQGAPIDNFGVGTNLVTGRPDAYLDGVYKLAFAHGRPVIKLSESSAKITLPYKKQVYRLVERDGTFWGADVVAMAAEHEIEQMYHPFEPGKTLRLDKQCRLEPLLHKVMEGGKRLSPPRSLKESAAYCQGRLAQLPAEYKRFDNPHLYKVGLSERLWKERNRLILEHKK